MSTEITDLTVDLGGDVVVDDVTIDIPTRQRLAIMGPSGAGKTRMVCPSKARMPIAAVSSAIASSK